MTPDALSAAADQLWDCWRAGARISDLPAALRPQTRAEGYQVQALLETRSQRPLFGWKIAATSAAGQAHVGVDGPMAGRLLAERVVPDGGACPLGANQMRVGEGEFAFRMGADLPPRAAPYRVEEVLAAVASLHPAIEIPDSRYDGFQRVGAAQLIADDACADRFVLGPATTADWRALDLAAHKVLALVNGEREHPGVGAAVLGDPRLALTWLANELSAHGVTLRAAEVVTTGTCSVPFPVAEGDHVVGDFGVLGRVSVTMTH